MRVCPRNKLAHYQLVLGAGERRKQLYLYLYAVIALKVTLCLKRPVKPRRGYIEAVRRRRSGIERVERSVECVTYALAVVEAYAVFACDIHDKVLVTVQRFILYIDKLVAEFVEYTFYDRFCLFDYAIYEFLRGINTIYALTAIESGQNPLSHYTIMLLIIL